MVTVLFADMVDSAATAATQDPERMRSALAVVFGRASQLIAQHGGTVEKFIGDQIMAVFGVPKAHEDDAERAVRAGLAIHDLAIELSETLGLDIRFRVGVNTGEVATGTGEGRDFLVTGQPVNVGARLFPAAEPGGLLVGPLTKSLTDSVIRYGAPITVKGKGTGVMQAWRVEGVVRAQPGDAPRGVEGLNAPLIGRDQEMALLEAALTRAVRELRPQLVTMLGDAGVGKSRLIREFAGPTSATVRVGRCLPYGEAIEYSAIRAVIAGEASIGPDEPQATAAAQLTAFAWAHWPGETGAAVGSRLSVLAGFAEPSTAMPGVSREDLPFELRWAFRKLITKAASDRPLLLILEDLHWAAGTLLDLVEDVVERCEGQILVACLARPELTDLRPGWGTQGSHASTIRLQPLEADAAEELTLALLRTSELPETLISDIVERAGGNPLYLEEIVRGLIASGHLRKVGDRWEAGVADVPTDVPDTLRGVITARLDGLDPPTRSLLQRGSVLGRYFSLQGVRALDPDRALGTDPTQPALRSGFLVLTEEGTAPGMQTYHFRHALIRDAVYASIPKHERRLFHLRAADWFETRRPEAVEDLLELVAHHIEQAYALSRDLVSADRGVIGRRAYAAIVSLTEARRDRFRTYERTVAIYDRAERLAAEMEIPLSERKNEFAWAAIVRHVPRHGDLDQSDIFRALEQVRHLGPTPGLAQLLAFAAQHAGPNGPAMAEESIRTARATGDPYVIAWALWLSREFVPLRDHQRNWAALEEVLHLARQHDLTDLLSFALVAMAERAHHAGDLTLARSLQEDAYAHAKASGSKGAIAQAAMRLGLGRAAIHDADAMVPYFAEGLSLAREAPNPVILAGSLWHAAYGEWQNGMLEQAREHAEECLRAFDERVWPGHAAQAHHNLARTYTDLGDLARARHHLTKLASLASTETTRMLLRMCTGHVASGEGQLTDAETSFREALGVMDRPDTELLFGGVPWDWARSLAREELAGVLAGQGRTREAKEMLAAAAAFWSDPLAAPRRGEIEAKIAALG
jgi:class 3 adenylate cyclase/tetratricopeptide (TPR) repeat protein